ncbi:MAG: hypothetical protein Q9195_003707 [Heterodermia aff. obscurata]
MQASLGSSAPALPFPISRISRAVERYFLFSADTITWLRREHHILGVLVGTLAQVPQQNVFLGIPLELQPEEARLLVERGLAYIVDDYQWHRKIYDEMTKEEKEAYKASLRQEGEDLARASIAKSQKASEQALRRRTQQRSQDSDRTVNMDSRSTPVDLDADNEEVGDSLFSPSAPETAPSLRPPSRTSFAHITPYSVTPTSSNQLLPTPPTTPSLDLPTVKHSSYALFKRLHTADYFLSPGIRFGCQFLVYPGDPLRFHSHFLAVSADWDEEIDLLDLVGGGRLGTGVKKSWLIGGPSVNENEDRESGDPGVGEEVRSFCIEWGGM